MRRPLILLLAMLISLSPAAASAQTRPAPIYSLPADGVWIDADWELVAAADKKLDGQMRISSVGQKHVGDTKRRWIEIKIADTKVNQEASRWRKFLLAEAAIDNGKGFPAAVVEGYRQNGPSGAVLRLTPPQLSDLFGLGFVSPDATFEEAKAEEVIQTKLGQFTTRHVHAIGKDGNRTLDYHGWLTKDVPFGWARFEIREMSLTSGAFKTIFTATVAKTGQGAKSEVDETKVLQKANGTDEVVSKMLICRAESTSRSYGLRWFIGQLRPDID